MKIETTDLKIINKMSRISHIFMLLTLIVGILSIGAGETIYPLIFFLMAICGAIEKKYWDTKSYITKYHQDLIKIIKSKAKL